MRTAVINTISTGTMNRLLIAGLFWLASAIVSSLHAEQRPNILVIYAEKDKQPLPYELLRQLPQNHETLLRQIARLLRTKPEKTN